MREARPDIFDERFIHQSQYKEDKIQQQEQGHLDERYRPENDFDMTVKTIPTNTRIIKDFTMVFSIPHWNYYESQWILKPWHQNFPFLIGVRASVNQGQWENLEINLKVLDCEHHSQVPVEKLATCLRSREICILQ